MSAARLNEAQRGVLLSSMSDASCALTLGRSTAWVVRMRRELAEASPDAHDTAPTPPAMATDVAPTPKPEARSPGVRRALWRVNRPAGLAA